MTRERNFGRGKYIPPAPDPERESKPQFVNEAGSPVERAIVQFEAFVRNWTAPAMTGVLFDEHVKGIRAAIRRIAPVPEVQQVAGHAVFKVELDEKYDLALKRMTPTFKNLKWCQNSFAGHRKRFPGEHFVICEIRETTITEKSKE